MKRGDLPRQAGAPAGSPATRNLPSCVAKLRQGAGFHQARRFDDALATYRDILMGELGAGEILIYAAVAKLEQGRGAEAADLLRAALFCDPQNAEAHSYLGNALLMAGQDQEAEASYHAAIALRPDLARAHSNMGIVQQRLGKSDDAAQSFQRAVTIEPNYALAQYHLCQALLAVDQVQDAIAAGERAVTLAPNAPEAHNNLGAALMKAERTEEAIRCFQQALAQRPNFIDALNNLSVACNITGRFDQALTASARCLALDPTSVFALASQSVAFAETGNQEALAELVDFDAHIKAYSLAPEDCFDNPDGFNRALERHVLNHPSLANQPKVHATYKGQHTGDLLAEPRGPVAVLEEIINANIRAYLAALPEGSSHPVAATAPKKWRLSVWSVILDGPGHQIPHIHAAGWMSGVYYVRVPDEVSGGEANDHAGWIEFGRPQDLYQSKGDPRVKLYQPAEGTMFLFPSYFFHRTVPTNCPDKRISIAFDVIRDD